jgi:hypothetical protein
MKIKRFIPLGILLGLSLLVLVATPAILYLTADYPKDPALKFSLNLRQGLSLAAFILIPVWIGAGVDALLARIKDNAKRKVTSLVFYLGSFFVCIALPILGIFLLYSLFSIEDGWQQLPTPPERPIAIAAAGQHSVMIETERGNYYYCVVNDDLCWRLEDKPSTLIIGNDYRTETTGNMPHVAPPGQVVSMLGIAYSNGPRQSESHFAILDDGTVWYLHHEVNNYTGSFIAGLTSIIILPFVTASAILLSGAGINAFARWLASRIWREAQPGG